jgi:hypothetical protein
MGFGAGCAVLRLWRIRGLSVLFEVAQQRCEPIFMIDGTREQPFAIGKDVFETMTVEGMRHFVPTWLAISTMSQG